MSPRKSKKAWKPGDEHVFSLRMPHWLYEELEKEAKTHKRSINNHLIWLIEERVRKTKGE